MLFCSFFLFYAGGGLGFEERGVVVEQFLVEMEWVFQLQKETFSHEHSDENSPGN